MEDSQSGVARDIREVMTVLWVMPAALKRDNSSVCRNKLGGTLHQLLNTNWRLELQSSYGEAVVSPVTINYREC